MAALARAVGSPEKAARAVEHVAQEMGGSTNQTIQVLAALVLCETGKMPEEVSKHLGWKEFEEFCSDVFKRWGYQVKENVLLRKPRAQIDIVAFGVSSILSVDCKHWQRGHSPSALRSFAQNQLRRSRLLRLTLDDPRPIATVILSLSEPAGGFVEGVAVVPVRTLRTFLGSLDSYRDLMQYE